MKKIVLTGGGSAGHVTPNIALLPLLKDAGFEIRYIGTKAGIEKDIVADAGLTYYGISAGKLRRYFSVKNFTDVFRIIGGYFQSRKILKTEKPDIVFSKGGFVTVPVVYAAHSLKIPVVLHESDYTPGLANRLCIPRADKICVSFEAAAKHVDAKKCVVTGSPVRKELMFGKRERGLEMLGFKGDKQVLLIMGGSLGAQAINDAVDESLDELTKMFDIVHIRGKEKLNPASDRPGYAQFEYISEELPDVFAAADLMLGRSGANAIFEALALSLPALYIPLPKGASRGDQILNAAYFEEKGFALVMQQEELTGDSLIEKLNELVKKAPELKRAMLESGMMSGTENVINVIFETAGVK